MSTTLIGEANVPSGTFPTNRLSSNMGQGSRRAAGDVASPAPVYLNGRFLRQSMTGVQRFSSEMALAIDSLAAADQWPETIVLAPRPGRSDQDKSAASYRNLRLREVGRLNGHLWEQLELPGAARGGILVNLGNTGPLLAGRRQVVVIHDASVFDTPESYSWRFRTWYKGLERGLVWTGTHIVTVSEFSRQRIAARLHIDPQGSR